MVSRITLNSTLAIQPVMEDTLEPDSLMEFPLLIPYPIRV